MCHPGMYPFAGLSRGLLQLFLLSLNCAIPTSTSVCDCCLYAVKDFSPGWERLAAPSAPPLRPNRQRDYGPRSAQSLTGLPQVVRKNHAVCSSDGSAPARLDAVDHDLAVGHPTRTLCLLPAASPGHCACTGITRQVSLSSVRISCAAPAALERASLDEYGLPDGHRRRWNRFRGCSGHTVASQCVCCGLCSLATSKWRRGSAAPPPAPA